jgi:hypothetical protein
MDYHEPDERWKIFGCSDDEAYLNLHAIGNGIQKFHYRYYHPIKYHEIVENLKN